jgi:hypothetical protein
MGGGPRVTSGEDSKQDYGTPDDFLKPVVERFGPIQFDLAAHQLNTKHERYFAPEWFVEKYDPDPKKKFDGAAVVKSLIKRGALDEEAADAVLRAVTGKTKCEIRVKNHDKKPYALDAFKNSWAELSRKFHTGSNPGLLWLNCEFSEIEPWALRCRSEAELGANVLLLTPAAVGSNWYRDNVAGYADVYELNGRLCFDGKNVFPKDCILSHFYNGATLTKYVWEWRKNKIWHSWASNKGVA